ncbi:MAG: DUF4390 domain-containing protein [Steroidobacteraceae bacterium]
MRANPPPLSRYPAARVVQRLLAILMLAFCVVGGTQALASEAPRRFEIRSAFVEPAESVYMLNARLDFALPEGARAAIQDGVALTLDLEIEVNRARRFWLDDTVATLEQHYELVYHALSERFLVRNLNSGEQTSWPTLEDAVESLQVVDRLPILDQSLVLPAFRYEVSLRARLDVRNLPEALRIVLFWVDDWRQQTEWYTWPLNL